MEERHREDRKKLGVPEVVLTVLQSRLEVKKERIIGEKVARVLMDEMGEEPLDNVRRKQEETSSRTVEMAEKSSHY